MCGELSENNIGQKVTVYGWVQKSRDLGSLKFIDLRDRTGLVQAVINKDATESLFNEAAKVRREFVLGITGEVAKRGGAVNTKISTGSIEIIVSGMDIISKSETPPIYIEDDAKESEAVRLKYRYLDLRKPSMQKIFLQDTRLLKL